MDKGIHVVAKDGSHGMASDAGDGRLRIRLDNGQEMLVSKETLIWQQDGTYFLPLGLSDLEGADKRQRESEDKIVLPIVAEELHVEKQTITNTVRIKKVINEHEEVIDEPLLREEVYIERVPINRVVEQASPARQEGETMIIPVYEEVLVVEKRLVLKEELHITRQRHIEHQPQRFTVREENVFVDRQLPDAQNKSE